MFFDELITMIGRRSRRSWQLAWPGVPKGCTSRMRTLDISGHAKPKPPSAEVNQKAGSLRFLHGDRNREAKP
jgi:hypothetical protein